MKIQKISRQPFTVLPKAEDANKIALLLPSYNCYKCQAL